jgi:hypothetical protein
MPRHTVLLLTLATLSATTILQAQSPDPAGPPSQPQPAPIQRNYGPPPRPRPVAATLTTAQPLVTTGAVATAQPVEGIFLRVAPNSSVSATTLTPDATELRIDRGLVNVSVHHPANSPQITVTMPGGQTALLKDGLYTFNAATNTVRVLKGEAVAYPANQKRIKVKEDHAVAFAGAHIKSTEFDPAQARADLIPYNPRPYNDGPRYGGGGGGYPGYGYGPYGDGFYGYGAPYAYGYGDPFGYYGYGYPFGFGLGFGYYGGFGGFRGGYGGFRGGFHGRR